jgi:hypothetical protein
MGTEHDGANIKPCAPQARVERMGYKYAFIRREEKYMIAFGTINIQRERAERSGRALEQHACIGMGFLAGLHQAARPQGSLR